MKEMSQKCPTDQWFILKDITSLKIHTLRIIIQFSKKNSVSRVINSLKIQDRFVTYLLPLLEKKWSYSY